MAFDKAYLKLKKNNPRGIPDEYTYWGRDDTIAEITAAGYFDESAFAPKEDPRRNLTDPTDTDAYAIHVQASDGLYEVQLVGGVASVVSGLTPDYDAALELSKVGTLTSKDTRYAPQLPTGAESVTLTSALTASTYAKEWNKLSSNIAYIAGDVSQHGTTYPSTLFVSARAPDNGSGAAISPSYVASFLFYGDAFEILYYEATGSIDVIIDGVKADKFINTLNTGQLRYLRVEFSSTKLRRIDLLVDNMRTGAIYTDATDTIQPTLNPKKAVIAGDSFTEGTAGTTGRSLGYVDQLRLLSGNFNIIKSGSGGTGWAKENSGRPALVDRAQTDIVDYNPDVVIIAMGINDDTDITQAVNDTLDIVESGLPRKTIVLVGSWTSGEASAQMIANTAVIQAAAEDRGHYFINPTGTANGDGWITGTGDAGSPAGDGNADIFVSSDGTHPNDDGHLFHAQRLYNGLLALGIKL